MNLARAFHRRRHGTGYSNGNAVNFTGVSGDGTWDGKGEAGTAIPGPTASIPEFRGYLGAMRAMRPSWSPDVVDAYSQAVDNWGASVVGGQYDENVQMSFESLRQMLQMDYNDAYSSTMLTNAGRILESARKSVAAQARRGDPAKDENGAPQLTAGGAIATAGGFSIGIVAVLAVVTWLVLKK